MKLKHWLAITAVLIGAVSPCIASDWTAQVSQLQSTNLGADCFYFTLSGVNVGSTICGGYAQISQLIMQ